MEAWVLAHEPSVRLGAFVLVFVAVALVEALAPRRLLRTSKGRRWGRNLALVALSALAVRGMTWLVPASAVAVALAAESRGFGLLHAVALPRPVAIAGAVVVLDLAIYFQHVLFHAVPALWRLHRVHHADLDFDVTTGTRFHPLEIVLSMGIKAAVVGALGPPVVAVVAFEVLLNATAMFNHANLRLPIAVDRVLRWVVVTPDVHRIHHSTIRAETDSNYGFNLPWWDRLFGTYRDQPQDGHEGMTIGLADLRETSQVTFPRLLAMPFSKPVARGMLLLAVVVGASLHAGTLEMPCSAPSSSRVIQRMGSSQRRRFFFAVFGVSG